MSSQQKTPVRRISLEDAKRQMEDVVFVDVRGASALKRNPEQVPSAIHVPLKEIGEQAKRLPRDRTLVTYCS